MEHRQRQHPQSATSARRGMALALLILSLAVVGTFAVGATQMVVVRHRLQSKQQRHLQAVALADAAVQRAAARLAAAPDYPGESWEVPAASLDGDNPATVVIRTETDPARPSLRRVIAQATWGEGTTAVKHTREVSFDPGSLEE